MEFNYAVKQEAEMIDNNKIYHESFVYFPRLERIRAYVEDNIGEPLSLGQAANIAGLEKTYFSKFFHDKTGICFHDWLNQIRIHHASELLKKQNLSITDVAYRVGFQDLRTFERVVKKHLGCTPTAMKKQIHFQSTLNHGVKQNVNC